jgi:hypothetical protein
MPASLHEKGVLARFDGLNCFFLAEFPVRAAGVNPADCLNPLVRILAVGFGALGVPIFGTFCTAVFTRAKAFAAGEKLARERSQKFVSSVQGARCAHPS